MQFQPSRRTGTRKMKLYQNRVLSSFLFSFYSFSSAKLNIECERDNLVISLPLNNENIANILELNAGNCTHENIPNGVENAISYSNCFAEIQIPSKECDLINTYSSSKMRTSGDFYMPTVNFSLGLLQGDQSCWTACGRCGAACRVPRGAARHEILKTLVPQNTDFFLKFVTNIMQYQIFTRIVTNSTKMSHTLAKNTILKSVQISL